MERGLLGLVAIGDESCQQVHEEVVGAWVARMFDLTEVLELIVEALDEGAFAQQQLIVDTPQRLKPHGCSGDAPPTGSRARLKGLPGPSGRDLPPQASSALTPLGLTRRAPRPRGVRPCPHGNGFPWH